MEKKILLLFVIFSVFVITVDSKNGQNCHDDDDDDDNDDNVCCEWKSFTFLFNITTCEKCESHTNNKPCMRWKKKPHCKFIRTVNITKQYCERKCCDGWKKDEYGQCAVPDDDNSQDIVCENGGSSAGDHCICPTGFSGTNCETPVCNPPCVNNGRCTGRDGTAVCVCPEGKFTGKQCEIPICDPECKYGGTCVADVYESKCECAEGYTGDDCGEKAKEGECPATASDGTCHSECSDDGGCPGVKKCCKYGCDTGLCTYPKNYTCTFNNKEFDIGDVVHKTPCDTCFCKYPDKKEDEQWECIALSCPMLACENKVTKQGQCCSECDDHPPTTQPPPPTPGVCMYNGTTYPHMSIIKKSDCMTCTCNLQSDGKMDWSCLTPTCLAPPCPNPIKIPGQCCSVCPGTTPAAPTTLQPHIGPMFRNCPRERLVLHTDHRNYINIRKQVDLTVYDGSGLKYAVSYSKEVIYAKQCNCSDNYHIIMAQSEADTFGRFASCIFTVHAFDNYPPVYTRCPSSIAAYEDEIIRWDEPEVSDNVHIKTKKFTSIFDNNSRFKEGSHVVVYVSIDHQGNVGMCNFLVAIYKRGTTDPTAPLELHNRDKHDSGILVHTVIGVLSALIIITVLFIAIVCYRRRKCQNTPPANANGTHGYDNAIYATPGTPPPSYGRSAGHKMPPKYQLEDEKPPIYEELDPKKVMKEGVQNPIYDTPDEQQVKS